MRGRIWGSSLTDTAGLQMAQGSDTSTGLRTQLLHEHAAPHRHHSLADTDISQQLTLTFRPLREARAHGGHKEAFPPAPLSSLSANPPANPEPPEDPRKQLLDDVTVYTHGGDAWPTSPGGSRWGQWDKTRLPSPDVCHSRPSPAMGRWGQRLCHPGLSLCPLPCLVMGHRETSPGPCSSTSRGRSVRSRGGGSQPVP